MEGQQIVWEEPRFGVMICSMATGPALLRTCHSREDLTQQGSVSPSSGWLN